MPWGERGGKEVKPGRWQRHNNSHERAGHCALVLSRLSVDGFVKVILNFQAVCRPQTLVSQRHYAVIENRGLRLFLFLYL